MQVRNSVTLIGNLGQDPNVRTTDAGLTITDFTLATNEYYRDKDGNRQTRTDWHRVKAFGKLAEVFAQHLAKGSQLAVVGSLRYDKWIDKHDQVRTTAEVIAHSFTFLSGGRGPLTDELTEDNTLVAEPAPAAAPAKASAAARKPAARKRKATTAKATTAAAPATADNGDDLPF